MYTREEREKAIKLYIQYDKSPSAVIREIGYPSRNTLVIWYKEYLKSGFKVREGKRGKYTAEQRKRAVEYYLEHGRSVSRTVKALGYPGKTTLCEWLNEDLPGKSRTWHCKASNGLVRCTQEQKKRAVIEYCTGEKTPTEISREYGVSPNAVYSWKKKMLGEERYPAMPKTRSEQSTDITTLTKEIEELQAREAALQSKLYQLQMEYDILEKTAEILKKDRGINPQTLSNHEKAEVIDALRDRYRLKELLRAMNVSKSSYCYQENRIRRPDKYDTLRQEIRSVFNTTDGRYGYRRIHAVLKKQGITASEKVVRRLMKDEKLVVQSVRRKKYSSYAGEISPEVANVINRDFHAETPNAKWVTDITEFIIPAGKVYLSPIIDCFDGLAVSWSIGTSPSAELVNTMLDEAISVLKEGEHPLVHSDRGSHYRWPGWIERMENAGLTRSMSRKGCSPDNAACEGFFGRLKNEMIYNRVWKDVSIEEFIEATDKYIRWYNEDRIKKSLGWMSPWEYRRSLGLTG